MLNFYLPCQPRVELLCPMAMSKILQGRSHMVFSRCFHRLATSWREQIVKVTRPVKKVRLICFFLEKINVNK